MLLSALFVLPTAHAEIKAAVAVDAAKEYQTWFGFGATHEILVYGGATGDVLSASQRQRAVDALFSQIKITTGQIPTTFEAPSTSTLESFFNGQANDNGDPAVIAANGFYTGLGDLFKTKVVDLAGSHFDLYPDVKINTKYASKWLVAQSTANYDGYLDECAEQALAGISYFKKTYGAVPSHAMLFNEPTSGNGELIGGSPQMIVDIVKRTGQKLAAAGLGAVGLVVPAEETEERSLEVATAIMADAEASKYVGAIAYHSYPYGSAYSYVPNILAGPGAGKPDAARVAVRAKLRDLAQGHSVQLWMTEVSNGYRSADGVNVMDFRAARGRAIHIHDELVYANVSAYFGMNSIWDTLSESFHFGTDGSALLTTAHDTLVLVEQSKDTVNISGMGRAIGHYARFVSRGAKRIDATSDNGLVLVSAFSEADQFVFVLVNDAAESAKVSLSIQGGALAKVVSGEQSTKDAYWKPLTTFAPTDPSNLDVTLPAESITSLVVSPSAVVIEPGGSAGTGNNAGGATGNAGAPSTGGKSGSSAGAPGTGGTDNQGAGAGTTGGKGQTSATASDSSGCGCRLASPAEPHGVWWLSGLGALAWVARRRFAARSLHPTLGKS